MKKILCFILALTLLIPNAFAVNVFNKDKPAGTDVFNVSDGDLRTNNSALVESLLNNKGFTNLKVTTAASATTLTVTADNLMLQMASSISYGAVSVNESIAITTSGASGLVTALTEAANTIYYVWIARKSADGTINGYLSTASDLTTLLTQVDSGYDQAALVSVVGNDGSSNFLDFTQDGREYWFATWPTVATGAPGVGSWTAIDLTPSTLSFFVPTALSTVVRGSFLKVGTTGVYGYISNVGVGTPSSSSASNQIFNAEGSNISQFWEFNVITTDTIYWAVSSSGGVTGTIALAGFTLNKL